MCGSSVPVPLPVQSASGSSLSSARERRRKSKQLRQQGKRSFSGSKMVLKSRPSSDIRKERQGGLSPAPHPPATGETSNSASVTNGEPGPGGVVASCEEVGSHKPDTGAEEVDGVGIPRTQSDPATYSLVKRVGSLNDKKQSPSTGAQPTHMHPSAGSADNVGSELQSPGESSNSHDKHGSGYDEGGERGSEELDSMLTILDATLLLPPPEEPRETSPTPPREAFRAGV